MRIISVYAKLSSFFSVFFFFFFFLGGGGGWGYAVMPDALGLFMGKP